MTRCPTGSQVPWSRVPAWRGLQRPLLSLPGLWRGGGAVLGPPLRERKQQARALPGGVWWFLVCNKQADCLRGGVRSLGLPEPATTDLWLTHSRGVSPDLRCWPPSGGWKEEVVPASPPAPGDALGSWGAPWLLLHHLTSALAVTWRSHVHACTCGSKCPRSARPQSYGLVPLLRSDLIITSGICSDPVSKEDHRSSSWGRASTPEFWGNAVQSILEVDALCLHSLSVTHGAVGSVCEFPVTRLRFRSLGAWPLSSLSQPVP